MRQAIVTKYLGPTNFRGARVKASCEALSVTVSWDDALYINANHTRAAKALAEQLNWGGQWVGGGLPGKDGNCYVHIPFPVPFDTPELTDETFYVTPKRDGDD